VRLDGQSPYGGRIPSLETLQLYLKVFRLRVEYIQEMRGPSSQSPRDRILWILDNNGGKMERSRLRAATGMRYALLNPILDELVKEGTGLAEAISFLSRIR